MSGKFADNPNYVEYETLLKELHQLIASGKCDEEEADAVRDKMDYSWHKLSRQEIERLGGLSGDLYMLNDDESFYRLDRSQEQWARDVETALCNEQWETALTLLRMPNDLPRDRVAYERARAYAALGHIDSALQFLSYALTRHPEISEYQELKTALSQPAFAEYERWLGWLHQLIAEGKGENRQAEVLRDAMNESSANFTPAEVQRLNDISSDLYILSGREVLHPSR